jgi:hypothetical protein
MDSTRQGRPRRTWVTIRLVKFDPKNPNKGRIAQLRREGRQARDQRRHARHARRPLGIRVGDVLVSVDGKSTATDREAAMTALRPEDPARRSRSSCKTPGEERAR